MNQILRMPMNENCGCELRVSDLTKPADDTVRFTIALLRCPLCKAAPELLRLLDLIVMEFHTDPMSVQCFDLRTVEAAKTIVAKLIHGPRKAGAQS